MSTSAAALPDEVEGARRQALRIGLAAALGMTGAVWLGSLLPFLAPVIAVQFLAASRVPLGAAPAVVTVGVIVATCQALSLLTGIAGGNPAVFVLLLGLFYLGCFAAQARGKGGPLPGLMLTVGVIVPMTQMLHSDLDRALIAAIAFGVMAGTLLSWAMHALFPDPDSAVTTPSLASVDPGWRRPVASAAILAGAIVLCLVDPRLNSATVLPITVAAVLGQLDLARSGRSALGLMLVNAIGGVAASIAFAVIELRPVLPVLFLVVLLAGLWFGQGAAAGPEAGRLYAGVLVIFLILLGLGISPLPGDTPESFATRIGYVIAGSAGTLWACLLFWPRPTRTQLF
jgi:hypothetical protein